MTDFMRQKEAAAFLGVSESVIKEMAHRHVLKAVKRKGFHVSDILRIQIAINSPLVIFNDPNRFPVSIPGDGKTRIELLKDCVLVRIGNAFSRSQKWTTKRARDMYGKKRVAKVEVIAEKFRIEASGLSGEMAEAACSAFLDLVLNALDVPIHSCRIKQKMVDGKIWNLEMLDADIMEIEWDKVHWRVDENIIRRSWNLCQRCGLKYHRKPVKVCKFCSTRNRKLDEDLLPQIEEFEEVMHE